MRRISTPWGPGAVVEEVEVAQTGTERSFTTRLELLETRDGERLLRLAYSTDGIARRGPVTLRPSDLTALAAAAAAKPQLQSALQELATSGRPTRSRERREPRTPGPPR